MKTNRSRHTQRLLTLLASGLLTLVSWADDTEIFIGNTVTPNNPNIMLVIDTSGSMNADVDSTAQSYDSGTIYGGSCATDRYYWSEDNNYPDCDDDNYILNADFVCNGALDELDEFGSYETQYARWEPNLSNPKKSNWKELDDGVTSGYVECSDDYGSHGDGINTDNIYPGKKQYGPFYDTYNRKRVHNFKNSFEATVFTGNFINYEESGGGDVKTRLEVVQDVANDILNTATNINVGVMRFSTDGGGGMVAYPAVDVASNRAALSSVINAMTPSGGTPLAETLWESYLYFSGGAVDYGDDSYPILSHASSTSSGNYISPIATECDRNYVILLSDGDATGDTGADYEINNLIGGNTCGGSDNCLDELAEYMFEDDVNSDYALDQSVRTYTVGFDIDHDLLQDAARAGGGAYYRADNYAELFNAFEEIIANIQEIDFSFVSPTVSVNTFHRLIHNNDLYYNVYRPSTKMLWKGNLKRYMLGYFQGEVVVMDATAQPAVDPTTGFFKESAKSLWTLGDPDGFETSEGGFASRLHLNRNVYTRTGTNDDLTAAENAVHEDNAAITAAMLTVVPAGRTPTLRIARGVQPYNVNLTRDEVGDALHSKPIILPYGGDEDDQDLTLYYTTNSGYLHAIDINNRSSENLERFAYVPKESLKWLKHIRNDPVGAKHYGLDGPISGYILNENGNFYVDDPNTETALVVFGERRGGRAYHALDVTDRDAPEFLWRIDNTTTGYAELGQTWSKPERARVRLNGVEQEVLFFAGGYDPNQDAPLTGLDSMGRGIFMADPLTGARLWGIGRFAGADRFMFHMNWSIPSDLAIIGSTNNLNDGLATRLYVGDMGGQIWRVDLRASNTGPATLASAGRVAQLGDTGVANKRRFYYPPAASIVHHPDMSSFIALAIGSGHRANPLGTPGSYIEDRFYMVKDPFIGSPPQHPITGVVIYPENRFDADMLDVTDDLTPLTTDLNTHPGYKVNLRENEKVISGASILDNRVFFNSYTGGASGDITCDPSAGVGSGHSYIIELRTGAPAQEGVPIDEDGDGIVDVIEAGDEDCNYRCKDTAFPMPPEPVLVFVEPDVDGDEDSCQGYAQVVTVVGSQVSDPDYCTSAVQNYWYEVKRLSP